MTQKQSPLEAVAWIEKLPDGGGTWGKSILDTVTTMEVEADDLEKKAEECAETAKSRRKIAKQAVKRADKEAVSIYSQEVIDKAKGIVPA
jgi:hypothetical protein